MISAVVQLAVPGPLSARGGREGNTESAAERGPGAAGAESSSSAAVPDKGTEHVPEPFHRISVQYSRGFQVEYGETYKLVRAIRPWQGAEESFSYLLVQRGTEPPRGYDGVQVIEIPVRSSVMMSTTYVTYLDMLGELETLKGMDTFHFVQNKKVLEMAEEGDVRAVGSGPSVNVELLLEMDPDLIMGHSIGGEWDTHPKLEEAGLMVVLNGEHMETHPLGRLEWIKFVSLFFNKEARAQEIYDSTVREYNGLEKLTEDVRPKPKVLVNSPYQGVWWVPGGKSFQAVFIRDAGGDFLWSDDDSTGALMLDIEAVYARASDADVWINPGMWNSLDDAVAEDERFTEFKPYQTGNIFNNNKAENRRGGSAYWETGVARPHIVLADLIKIFHPELLPEHDFVYYYKLR